MTRWSCRVTCRSWALPICASAISFWRLAVSSWPLPTGGETIFDCRLTSPIEADDSSRLCDDVAGWATALQLIALSARQNNSSAQHSARRLAGINASHLSDYLVDEVLDNVDARTRNFLLKSSLLRSMNDALIVRVTGEENGQMQLEEIERRGCSCSGWMIPANGSAITRCLAASCASAVSGSWRLNYRRSTAPRRKAGWRKVSQRGHPPCAGGRRCQNAARYLAQSCPGHV